MVSACTFNAVLMNAWSESVHDDTRWLLMCVCDSPALRVMCVLVLHQKLSVQAIMRTAHAHVHADHGMLPGDNYLQRMCLVLACACSGGSAARGSCSSSGGTCRWVETAQYVRRECVMQPCSSLVCFLLPVSW
jgi:hypothetical protein